MVDDESVIDSVDCGIIDRDTTHLDIHPILPADNPRS